MAGGDKISKTKGGAEPIPEAIEKYGVDAMRLYYCHVGSSDMDVEWEEGIVSHYRSRIRKIFDQASELMKVDGKESDMDTWLKSIVNLRIKEVTDYLDAGDFRDASNVVFFNMPNDLKWYIRRGGGSRDKLQEALSMWVKLIQPFTPHMAEEIWEKIGGADFVSLASWPEPSKVDNTPLMREGYVTGLLEDMQRIKKMTDIDPDRIILYTASDWKWDVLKKLIKMAETGDGRINPGDAIKSLMQDPEMRKRGKAVPKLIGRLSKQVVKMGEEEKRRYEILRDERDLLISLAGFLSDEMGSEVRVFSQDDPERDDPMGKAKGSQPLKPAIFME